jgi:hypothetical protein
MHGLRRMQSIWREKLEFVLPIGPSCPDVSLQNQSLTRPVTTGSCECWRSSTLRWHSRGEIYSLHRLTFQFLSERGDPPNQARRKGGQTPNASEDSGSHASKNSPCFASSCANRQEGSRPADSLTACLVPCCPLRTNFVLNGCPGWDRDQAINSYLPSLIALCLVGKL